MYIFIFTRQVNSLTKLTLRLAWWVCCKRFWVHAAKAKKSSLHQWIRQNILGSTDLFVVDDDDLHHQKKKKATHNTATTRKKKRKKQTPPTSEEEEEDLDKFMVMAITFEKQYDQEAAATFAREYKEQHPDRVLQASVYVVSGQKKTSTFSLRRFHTPQPSVFLVSSCFSSSIRLKVGFYDFHKPPTRHTQKGGYVWSKERGKTQKRAYVPLKAFFWRHGAPKRREFHFESQFSWSTRKREGSKRTKKKAVTEFIW